MHLCSVFTIIAPEPCAAPCVLQLPQMALLRSAAEGLCQGYTISRLCFVVFGKGHFPHGVGLCSLGGEMKSASLGFGL